MGSLEEIHFPMAMEQFVDYAIVTINGRKLKGKFPFPPDFHFHYSFLCSRVDGRYGVEYKIEQPGTPAFEPLPLSLTRLRTILERELLLLPEQITDICNELRSLPQLQTADFSDLQPDQLLQVLVPAPTWLQRLARHSMLFRFPFMKQLSRLWPIAELRRLSMQRLGEITMALVANPEDFCYGWKTEEFGLPELQWPQLELYARLNQRELDPLTRSRLAIYKNVKALNKRENRITVESSTVSNWGLGHPRICAPVGVLRPISVLGPDGQRHERWLINNYLVKMRSICDYLGRLFVQASDAIRPRAKQPAKLHQLNAGQQAIYERLQQQNFFIVLGDAGTGKTLLARFIYQTYAEGKVMPVAYYGRVAANLRAGCGRGMTIHKLAQLLRSNTVEAQKLRKQIRILIIDEGSVLTIEVLHMALSMLPNLRKIAILGDEKQMPSPTPGPLFKDFIAFYQQTPVVHRLTEIMRVAEFPGAETIRENSRRIAAGRWDLTYTRNLVDTETSCPWVVLHRHPIPEALQRLIGADAREQRIQIMVKSLQPVVHFFKNPAQYQIATQKNDVRAELNCAMDRLLHDAGGDEDAGAAVRSSVFRSRNKIMFTKTSYGNVPPLPANPERRAAAEREPDYFLRSCDVMNGEVCTISTVVDCCPVDGRRVPVANTAAPKVADAWQRLLVLDTGKQVNLSFYSIGNIVRGDVATVASLQGSEFPAIVYYVHEDFSSTLEREQFYTVVTRGKRWVIVICEAKFDSLENSDIGRIIRNVGRPPENIIANWLPAYHDPPRLADLPDAVEEEEEEEEDHDDNGEPAELVLDEL